MHKKALLSIVAVVVLGLLWFYFRPERLFVNRTVHEDLPPSLMPRADIANQRPAPIYAGHFHSGVHETQGNAKVYELSDGRRILRLSGFETSNGPDVRVYLVAAPDVTNNTIVKRVGFVDLGALKGNKGDQNYELSSNIDLSKYSAVSIWCRRFSVNFGAAPLARQ